MKNLLKQLGFEHMTGSLWKHEKIGIIVLSDEDKPTDLAQKIYGRGYSECQAVIKSTLGIKD